MILALRYDREYDFIKVAEVMFTTEKRVTELHDAGVCQVHNALLLSVSGEGTGPRTVPAVFRVSSADRGTALERAGAVPWKRCAECLQQFPASEFNWLNRSTGRKCSLLQAVRPAALACQARGQGCRRGPIRQVRPTLAGKRASSSLVQRYLVPNERRLKC